MSFESYIDGLQPVSRGEVTERRSRGAYSDVGRACDAWLRRRGLISYPLCTKCGEREATIPPHCNHCRRRA